MAKPVERTRRPKHGRYLVAMVLGTALSAAGVPAVAAETRAVQDISRYCTACWRNARLHPDSWPDCTQEVFSRLLERVSPDAWGQVLRDEAEERREFLRAIDAVKKRTQRARRGSSLTDAVADRRDLQERSLADRRESVQVLAARHLTPRQQEIVRLSLNGWSVHEIAERLAVPAARVSDEKYKAVRRLRAQLAEE
jgi:RNA polymerase sigma factor (sigma-70 family)